MGNSVVQHNIGNYWALLHGTAGTKKKKLTTKIENQFFLLEKAINLAVLFYLSKIDKDHNLANSIASKSCCV